jgi:hypothetical protein
MGLAKNSQELVCVQNHSGASRKSLRCKPLLKSCCARTVVLDTGASWSLNKCKTHPSTNIVRRLRALPQRWAHPINNREAAVDTALGGQQWQIQKTTQTNLNVEGYRTKKGRQSPAMKKPTKRISFQPTATVRRIDSNITPEEHSRSYHSKDELRRFRLEVVAIHTLARRLSYKPPACGLHTTKHDCVIGLQAHSDLRGLERYLCPTRATNAIITRKALLEHQSNLNAHPNKTREEKLRSLASMSIELSHRSKKVAEEVAKLDSLQVRAGPRTLTLLHPGRK